jgi:Prephenate dehydratase
MCSRRNSRTQPVAGVLAASEYGGRILARGIEDDKQNFTRFLLIDSNLRKNPGANKTSSAST